MLDKRFILAKALFMILSMGWGKLYKTLSSSIWGHVEGEEEAAAV